LSINIFKREVPAANNTQCVTITKINWLVLFEEIIAVHTKPINIVSGQNAALLNVKEVTSGLKKLANGMINYPSILG
jgi:hypothetical protein